jgi:hypothetical protein
MAIVSDSLTSLCENYTASPQPLGAMDGYAPRRQDARGASKCKLKMKLRRTWCQLQRRGGAVRCDVMMRWVGVQCAQSVLNAMPTRLNELKVTFNCIDKCPLINCAQRALCSPSGLPVCSTFDHSTCDIKLKGLR